MAIGVDDCPVGEHRGHSLRQRLDQGPIERFIGLEPGDAGVVLFDDDDGIDFAALQGPYEILVLANTFQQL